MDTGTGGVYGHTQDSPIPGLLRTSSSPDGIRGPGARRSGSSSRAADGVCVSVLAADLVCQNPHDQNNRQELHSLGPLLDSSHRTQAVEFLKTGVCQSTSAGYASDWKQWEKFHRSNGSSDLYLRSIEGNDAAKATVWTLFILHLYSNEGKRAEQVHGILSGVRHNLLANLSGISFLSHEAVINARRACRRSPEEHRVYLLQQRLKVLLPASLDMLDNLRDFLWKERSWGFEDLLYKAIWLACCLSFDRGPRLGNVSLKDGKHALDHNIRCDFAHFSVEKADGTIIKIPAGPDMTVYDVRSVVALTIEIPTSKTTGSCRRHQLEPIVIARSTSRSSQLLDDFTEFVQHSGSHGPQPLLSFYRRSDVTGIKMHKTLTKKEINSEIKACALRCGLPPKFFSGMSLRKGNATQSSLGRLSTEERNRAGGWAINSKVPDRHYDKSVRVHGALDAASNVGAKSLTIHDIRSMVPS